MAKGNASGNKGGGNQGGSNQGGSKGYQGRCPRIITATGEGFSKSTGSERNRSDGGGTTSSGPKATE